MFGFLVSRSTPTSLVGLQRYEIFSIRPWCWRFLLDVLQDTAEERFGAVLQKNRLIVAELHPIGDTIGVEGHLRLVHQGVEDKEIVILVDIEGVEGDGHSVLDFADDFAEKAHSCSFLITIQR